MSVSANPTVAAVTHRARPASLHRLLFVGAAAAAVLAGIGAGHPTAEASVPPTLSDVPGGVAEAPEHLFPFTVDQAPSPDVTPPAPPVEPVHLVDDRGYGFRTGPAEAAIAAEPKLADPVPVRDDPSCFPSEEEFLDHWHDHGAAPEGACFSE